MLKCEIIANLAQLEFDIYLFRTDPVHEYYVHKDGYVEATRVEDNYSATSRMKPFISIPYDHADVLFDKIVEYRTRMKLEDGTAISAKNAHISDLNRVLNHFMDKDKK